MNHTLHICTKDLRRLRLPVGLFLALLAVFIVMDVRYVPGPDAPLEIPRIAVEVLLVLTTWWIVGAAVQEEPLLGDREFWITRPYRRQELLLAKLLLLTTVITVPLVISDGAILMALKFPLAQNAGGLALRAIANSLWLIVPPFAMAALTRNLTQYAGAWFLIAIYAVAAYQYISSSPFLNTDFAWSVVWVIALVSLVIMMAAAYLEYRGVRAAWCRVIFALALVPPVIPVSWDNALRLQNTFAPPAERTSRISISRDHNRAIHEYGSSESSSQCPEVPVEVKGLEEAWHLVPIGGIAEVFSGTPHTDKTSWLRRKPDGYWQTACGVPNGLHPHYTINFTTVFAVMDEEANQTVEIRDGSVTVPGVGRCDAIPMENSARLLCRAAVHPPSAGTVRPAGEWSPPPFSANTFLDEVDGLREISYFTHSWAPFNVLPGFTPVFQWICRPEENDKWLEPVLKGAFVDLTFLKRRPIAFLKRTYTVQND